MSSIVREMALGAIFSIALGAVPATAQRQTVSANLEIRKDGVYLDGNAVDNIAALKTALQILAARRPEPVLYVSSQPGVSPAAVTDAVSLAQAMGLTCVTGRVPPRPIPYGYR